MHLHSIFYQNQTLCYGCFKVKHAVESNRWPCYFEHIDDKVCVTGLLYGGLSLLNR